MNALHGDTTVLTMEFGPMRIRDLLNRPVTLIAGDGNPRSALVTAIGRKRLFNFTFRQNTSGPTPGVLHHVCATRDFRWKLADGSFTDALEVNAVIPPPIQISSRDCRGVLHGLIFGDGSAHKRRVDHERPGVSQGRTYASLRVCKQGEIRDEIHRILDEAGYKYSIPAHAGGQRVYYIGKFEFAKEPPFTNDPEYIASFIYGWWLADGSKAVSHAYEISTADELAANWLISHASYAGFVVTMNRVLPRREGDGSYSNGLPLRVIRIRGNLAMRLAGINPCGPAPAFAIAEPTTSAVVTASGLLIQTS